MKALLFFMLFFFVSPIYQVEAAWYGSVTVPKTI
jgi:hypothetical protein